MNIFEKYRSIFREEQLHELPIDISKWPVEWLEAYEERAAIMEYDGELNRCEAEKQAEKLQCEEYNLRFK